MGMHIGVQKHANCFDLVFIGVNSSALTLE